MNKEDLFILVLALLLLAAMIYTFMFGGQSSKHGVSIIEKPGSATVMQAKKTFLIYVKAGSRLSV